MFLAGQKLRAQALNDLLSGVVAAADVTVSNTTTLANATGLAVPLSASARYALDLWVWWSTGATPDIKFGLSFPGGTTGRWGGGGTSVDLSSTLFSTSGDNARISGTLITTGAGTLQLRFAQNTADASNTILRAGSWLQARRID